MKRLVEVVRLQRRHPPAPLPAALPEPVLQALASIAGDLRHLPGDCIRDPAKLLCWLRRMAGRVTSVGRMRVSGAVVQAARPPAPPPPRPAPAREIVEAAFGRTAPSAVPGVRTIVSRRGHTVRVEVCRALSAG